MSNCKQNTGEDYPEASRRHCEDAFVLLNNNRFDGAAYLAGYAVECILKTVIQTCNPKVRKIHNLKDLCSDAFKFISMSNSNTYRYMRNFKLGIPYCDPPGLNGWKETLRYYPQGTIPVQIARNWVSEANNHYVHLIGALIKDGRVTL